MTPHALFKSVKHKQHAGDCCWLLLFNFWLLLFSTIHFWSLWKFVLFISAAEIKTNKKLKDVQTKQRSQTLTWTVSRCLTSAAAHRSVWGRSSCGICLCLSAWRRSSSAGAPPWLTSLLLLTVQQEKRSQRSFIMLRSQFSLQTRSWILAHWDSVRAAEQEMNSTHSFPNSPSPPPSPPPVPPPTLLPS